jgi:uncharacterized damage-inducible protein DinB
MATRRSLVVLPHPAAHPAIGRALWRLADVRERTKRAVAGIPRTVLDWEPSLAANSVGTLLAHLAAIEADWLYSDVLAQPIPADILVLLPPTVRDTDGHLTRVHGRDVAAYLEVLDAVRARLEAVFQVMTEDDYWQVRRMAGYDVTPEWCLYHLLEHEAAHRGEMETVRTLAETALGGEGERRAEA